MSKTVSESAFHKELDLIQDIIKRMAQNSFQVKAWLIGILSALVLLESSPFLPRPDRIKFFLSR